MSKILGVKYKFVSDEKHRGLQIWAKKGKKSYLVAKFDNLVTHGYFGTDDDKIAEIIRNHPGFVDDVNRAVLDKGQDKYIAEIKDGIMPIITKNKHIVRGGAMSVSPADKERIAQGVKDDLTVKFKRLLELQKKTKLNDAEKKELTELNEQFK